MSEQIGPDEGIEHSLDSGIAEQDHTDDSVDPDLGASSADHVDPDDPEAAIEQATERSTQPSGDASRGDG